MCGATTSTSMRGVVGSSMSSDSSEPESSVAEFAPRHEDEEGWACIREGGSIVGMLIFRGERDEGVLLNASLLPMRGPEFKCVKDVLAISGGPVASESGEGGCHGKIRRAKRGPSVEEVHRQSNSTARGEQESQRE